MNQLLPNYLVTERTMFQLDGPTAGHNYEKDEDEEQDFFEAAGNVPVVGKGGTAVHLQK